MRLRAAEIDVRQVDIARLSGVSPGSINEYWKGTKAPGADRLFDIAKALRCNPEWLATGNGPMRSGGMALDVEDHDWIFVPRFDLAQMTDTGKGDPIETIPLRKDWLNRHARASTGLWITEMPPSTLEGLADEGDTILCRDAEHHTEEGIYLYRFNGVPLVRRFSFGGVAGTGFGDGTRGFWHQGIDEPEGMRIVARVLGAIKLQAF